MYIFIKKQTMDKKIISLLMLMICSSAFIMAQDDSGEKKVKLKLSGDLVSSYIFRGVLAVSYTHLDVYKRQE